MSRFRQSELAGKQGAELILSPVTRPARPDRPPLYRPGEGRGDHFQNMRASSRTKRAEFGTGDAVYRSVASLSAGFVPTRPQAEVKEVGLSRLAFMIEHLCPKQEIQAYLNGEPQAYQGRYDTAVLACTHFPFAREQFCPGAENAADRFGKHHAASAGEAWARPRIATTGAKNC